jgi:hypothetical protein
MKYAWHCTYCGRASYFTDILPKPGYALTTEAFIDSRDTQHLAGAKLACNFCSQPMILSPASIKSLPLATS